MLKKIASFTINHDTLTPGMYVSRIDGDCVTYDLRLKFPNQGIMWRSPPCIRSNTRLRRSCALLPHRSRWCISGRWAAGRGSISSSATG